MNYRPRRIKPFMQSHYDLIIVGAGLAGNCLALSLKSSGLSIALVEAADREQLRQSPAGDRALALAAGTVQSLIELGAWQAAATDATPIQHIHVSDRGHFGKTRLHATDYQVDALGYVIAARDIEQSVAEQLDDSSFERLYNTRLCGLRAGDDAIQVHLKQGEQSLNLSAQLVVGADGGFSSVRQLLDIPQRETEYGQTALVTTVLSAKPHQNTAFERFTEVGPLALLPSKGRHSSVVWTRSHEQADELMHASETEFLQSLQDCFGYRLGELKLAAPRRAFALKLIRAARMIDKRVVLIGNAVHQLHPVAGQGFNLGIRDVMLLGQTLRSQAEQHADLGNDALLSQYARQRQRDHDATIGFTNNLVHLFSNQWIPAALARNTGLTVLDHLPFAKRWLAQHAMGFANGQAWRAPTQS